MFLKSGVHYSAIYMIKNLDPCSQHGEHLKSEM